MTRAPVLGLLCLLAACSSDPTVAGPLPPVALEVVSGGGQAQLAGYPLDEPIVLRAVDSEGRPVADVEVTFDASAPGAELELSGTATGADGTVSATWRLAPRLGDQTLRFTMPAVSGASALTVSANGTGAAVRAISGDAATGMCAVYLDGRLGCWKAKLSPPLVPPTAAIVDGLERYRDVALRWDFSDGIVGACAVTEAGRVRCFELSEDGAVPQAWDDVGGTHPPFVHLTSHRFGTHCAIDESGGLWCWGHNQFGLVGDGTTEAASTPQRVAIADPVTEVSIETALGCALTTAGEVWCWGKEARDRLDEPVGTAPSRVTTELRFGTIAAFNGNALCGLAQGSTLYCWGHGAPIARWPERISGGPNEAVLSHTGVRSVTGQRELAFVTTTDGVGAWWGQIATLETPVAEGPQSSRYPLGVSALIQREESNTVCGDDGPTTPAICFINKMFLNIQDRLDTTHLIGFGVPGP